ncbi:hypothetical protein BC833DRAFT_569255 [Globomyces pollinis-pini]|nr:hypothetical protein BC833DRAFT_569255 [Globomyces pollinis-pini]
MFGLTLKFEQHFVGFGEYHSNRWNQIIHMIFFPILVWSTQLLLTFIPVYNSNFSWILTGSCVVYYICLHQVYGSLYAPIVLYSCYTANQFSTFNLPILLIASILFVGSWGCQIISHGVNEGEQPPTFERPIEAVIMGPFVIFCFTLFSMGLFKDHGKHLQELCERKYASYMDNQSKTK